MSETDDQDALDWFLADAKAQGLSLAEYERKYGIVLEGFRFPNPAEQRIRRHEVSGGLMSDEDYRQAEHVEKRRAVARRRTKVEIRSEESEEAA